MSENEAPLALPAPGWLARKQVPNMLSRIHERNATDVADRDAAVTALRDAREAGVC